MKKTHSKNKGEGCQIPEKTHRQLKSVANRSGKLSRKKLKQLAPKSIAALKVGNEFNADAGVPIKCRIHYTNLANGVYGIGGLIMEIMKFYQAIFPTGIEKTEKRSVAIAVSLFSEQITQTVRIAVGDNRYPNKTVVDYLSTHLGEKIGRIQLENQEDSTRPKKCCKPRTKYYLVRPEDPARN